MNKLTQLIKDDMKPALGVTEPGAIAFAASKARSYTIGEIESVEVILNSGMYKNAFTCGIPNSEEVGNVFAAALGVVAGNHQKGLEALADVTPNDNIKAKKLVNDGKVTVKLSGISSNIYIKAIVKTRSDTCEVTIRESHTNICEIKLNGKVLLMKENEGKELDSSDTTDADIHAYTLKQLYEYILTVDIEEIDFIKQAYDLNMDLFQEGLHSEKTMFASQLYKMNDNKVFSNDECKTAQLLCNAAIEARVIGLDKAAMSITGSGAHGIICTMPLYALYKVNNLSEEKLLRATALSYLITMYIKEYSGRLSAFCGCAIAAGTGMACAMVYLKGGTFEQMVATINNMASSITGMICDGGNQGCTMKGIVAVDAAFKAVALAMNGAVISDIHGINGKTPELTMKHMGLIASPGMVRTEKTIVDIMESKLKN
jgi:L-cysteine desulfidase